jgi:hypothetical protein
LHQWRDRRIVVVSRIIVAIRPSPDWSELARDYRDFTAIDPLRYLPPRFVPDFPLNIAELIGRWNALSSVDFFACRARLRAIAAATWAASGAQIVAWQDLPAALAEGPAQAVFFSDDDDWYAPDLPARLADIDVSAADVAVFPMARVGFQSITFVDPSAVPMPCFVRPARFLQRYHTNNYALLPRAQLAENLAPMQDHFDASAHGDLRGFVDRHVPRIVSATNKTPCAASWLQRRLDAPEDFAAGVNAYVDELASHHLADGIGWMRGPMDATIRLFSDIATRARRAKLQFAPGVSA